MPLLLSGFFYISQAYKRKNHYKILKAIIFTYLLKKKEQMHIL